MLFCAHMKFQISSVQITVSHQEILHHNLRHEYTCCTLWLVSEVNLLIFPSDERTAIY